MTKSDHSDQQVIRRLKRANYTVFCLVLILTVSAAAFGISYRIRHRFTTDKWITNPRQRTQIVEDLLQSHALIGMGEDEIHTLLGPHDNDKGYFRKENRYVYWMGPERSLFCVDSEWLILDFSEQVVTDCFITRD